MESLIEKLIQAQKFAMSNRPPVGGFPYLAEVLRQAGVKKNLWTLPACQSVYVMNDGCVIQQGTPLITGTHPIAKFNQQALISALRTDQAGKSTFPEFLQATWDAGVTNYTVDFLERKVTYFSAEGDFYTEDYPAVEVKTTKL